MPSHIPISYALVATAPQDLGEAQVSGVWASRPEHRVRLPGLTLPCRRSLLAVRLGARHRVAMPLLPRLPCRAVLLAHQVETRKLGTGLNATSCARGGRLCVRVARSRERSSDPVSTSSRSTRWRFLAGVEGSATLFVGRPVCHVRWGSRLPLGLQSIQGRIQVVKVEGVVFLIGFSVSRCRRCTPINGCWYCGGGHGRASLSHRDCPRSTSFMLLRDALTPKCPPGSMWTSRILFKATEEQELSLRHSSASLSHGQRGVHLCGDSLKRLHLQTSYVPFKGSELLQYRACLCPAPSSTWQNSVSGGLGEELVVAVTWTPGKGLSTPPMNVEYASVE
ncbi:hypothetical protein F751_0957 [Auxenochlorella protothecoides]|uniref:Uncharacterized protein n=1 Tax=Auxenochlorella protothecoides TaxID=3075 RepID=A0A087SDD9_AUXPR|nr:hypothetical protein F751_0957 [Auxenochlorella protothecoides]KFM23743.1 hypothetical protein F751_0957 [Auxenochlorella protothecoides]